MAAFEILPKEKESEIIDNEESIIR
jgi:hypothetical protein